MLLRLLGSSTRLSLVIAIVLAPQALATPPREVATPVGEVHRVVPPGGFEQDLPPGSGRVVDLSAEGAAGVQSPSVERVTLRDPATGRNVDSEGTLDPPAKPVATPTASAQTAAERVTIDRMSFGVTYYDTYNPTTGLVVFGPARVYYLSDGSSWNSGAGSYYLPRAPFSGSEVDGTTIRYSFDPPSEGFLYKQTDYDSGNHSSNGSLGPAGPLVLEATLGSTTGTISGVVSILSNVPANYSEPRFNYWSAPMGAIVPFEATFTLRNGATFTETTFGSSFSYSNNGIVDFADASYIPPLTDLEIIGTAQVRAGSETQFHAVATYASGARQNVTGEATWSVIPTEVASVDSGLLTTAAAGCDGVTLELRATFTSNDSTQTGTRSVVCREVGADEWAEYWETYQGDERHSGYVPISLEPEVFTLRWRRQLAPGRALNPVTAADGKVFASLVTYFSGGDALFALDARDGELLWSRGFGSPFSVNPPAYGYGNVYIQTGNHASDTYLWAFDAATGALVFQSPHGAQWERYFAPTIYDGSVYVNGGYYGGMYAFDAFSGASLWFANLPQYDGFTPAVDAEHVYAYVGEYSPALYVVDRETGGAAYQIADPNFDWNGWSMNLAPVLGSMDDVVAIHDGRLIRFDLATRKIGLELQADFSGQPSVAKGVIYAINGGSVEARDESSGALRWRWTPSSGAATEHLIVTDTHVLARTKTTTWAIELLSGEGVWSYPEAGHMAVGEETLYIASDAGVLTAISIPEYTPASPTEIEIEGPIEVQEFTTAAYEAWVRYDDGRVRNRTNLSEWSVEPSDYAAIDAHGELAVGEMLVPSQAVRVRAAYREGEAELEGELEVSLGISVSLDAFVDRNVEAALAAKRRALEALAESDQREAAAIRVVEDEASGQRGPRNLLMRTLNRLRNARFWGLLGKSAVEKGAAQLEEELAEEVAQPGRPSPAGRSR